MECTGNVRRARSADNPRTMNLELVNKAAATAHEELASITGNEHYSSSKRIRTLKASFAKLRQEPVREPLPLPLTSLRSSSGP